MEATVSRPEDVLLHSARSEDLLPLEAYFQVREPDQFRLYARGLPFRDVAALYGPELRAGHALVYRMPPSSLNPSYWEPHSKQLEDLVRAKTTGLITREREGRTFLWRADQIPPTRLLRDGLDVPVELLLGFAFRVDGEALLSIGRFAEEKREPLDWVCFSGIPKGPISDETLMLAHDDITQMRVSLTGEKAIFSSDGAGVTRLLFAERRMIRRALSAMLRSHVHASVRHPLGPITDGVLDRILRAANGRGITSSPKRDFVRKERTYETVLHLGKTEWSAGIDPPSPDERLLLYYDRVSGIWALAS